MPDISRRTFITASAGIGAAAAFLPVSSAQAADTTIPTTYQQQQKPNWCSPAATRIALSAAGVLPTQAALADGLGVVGTSGLQDPYAIARVLNNRLGLGDGFRYFLNQDMNAFDDYVSYGVSINKPVVYNVVQVGSQTYTGSGHYITITGRRPVSGGVQYRISDPDSPTRTGNWYSRADVKSWNKYGRYTAYGFPG